MMEANELVSPGAIKRSTLARYFKEQGLDRKTLTQSHTIHRRFQYERPNQLWQSNILYGPYLPDPNDPQRNKRTYLVAFIDDFSRLVPHTEFYWDEKYPTVEYTLKKGILKRGLPEAIYIDHGLVYSTRKLDAICAALGIRKLQCQPYSPQSKDKPESHKVEPKLSTGIKPLSQLANKHHQEQQQQAACLTGHIAKVNQKFFTLADFVHFMAQSLGKKTEAFHAREIEAIKTFLETYPNITADCVGVAIGKAVLKQGYKQHISIYLEAIKQLFIKWQNEH